MPDNRRGLLASPGLEGQPMKGVYFFPGESRMNDGLYTTHPLDPRDEHWNSDPSTRTWVMDRMVQAHINTVVMSYWSNMPQWSPMDILPPPVGGSPTLLAVLEAVQGRPLVILPTIEGGYDPDHPEIPHWQFQSEFPSLDNGQFAPGLVERIGQLFDLFQGNMDRWARIYDRDGTARYAVHVLHVCSDVLDPGQANVDENFAGAFYAVAAAVEERFQVPIGFTLDPIPGRYSPSPQRAGAVLERTAPVLAIQGFASEVFSGLVKNGPPCSAADWHQCQPYDNNSDNLERLVDWKRQATRDWVATGVPVILDVSNGFDGRIVWRKDGTGFWGDNLDYTEDRWRNWVSELKGPGIKGITFNCWNGYTEGYAAVPSTEHGQTVYNWLMDLLEPPPWDYSHMHYVNGMRTHRVYGGICQKWIELGADRGFGAPVSDERQSFSNRGRMQFFADGKTIYWSPSTGAHEVHGLVGQTYQAAGGDASCLGFPVSDETPNDDGSRASFFEHGRIDWRPGDTGGHITCS